jgi:hypothetical protein
VNALVCGVTVLVCGASVRVLGPGCDGVSSATVELGNRTRCCAQLGADMKTTAAIQRGHSFFSMFRTAP